MNETAQSHRQLGKTTWVGLVVTSHPISIYTLAFPAFRAVLEQFRSSFGAVSEQFGAVSERLELWL